MSLFGRIWQKFMKPTRYVGRDLERNRFYEHPSSSGGPRTKRTVQYRQADDMWHYIDGGRRLPVQWSAWLSHTRPDPPTLEELREDLERQQRVLSNAALIEAHDRAERAQALHPAETIRFVDTQESSSTQTEPTLGRPESTPHDDKAATARLPPMASNPSYEPRPWTPRARLRHNDN